jgi:hypothetical protein
MGSLSCMDIPFSHIITFQNIFHNILSCYSLSSYISPPLCSLSSPVLLHLLMLPHSSYPSISFWLFSTLENCTWYCHFFLGVIWTDHLHLDFYSIFSDLAQILCFSTLFCILSELSISVLGVSSQLLANLKTPFTVHVSALYVRTVMK